MSLSFLTPQQRKFLELLGKNKILSKKFYLTGGTALVAFYLPYRISDDLDFFSQRPIDTQEIIAFLKSSRSGLGFDNFEFNTSFNRNLFFLKFGKGELKTEFTYFPFPRIDELPAKTIPIDSPIDIAVNKLFTIYQKPRSRDFTDLFMINKKFKFTLKDLAAKARIKFDTNIDPIKLGSQLILVQDLKDYPKLIKPIKPEAWIKYFLDEAKSLKRLIFSQT